MFILNGSIEQYFVIATVCKQEIEIGREKIDTFS